MTAFDRSRLSCSITLSMSYAVGACCSILTTSNSEKTSSPGCRKCPASINSISASASISLIYFTAFHSIFLLLFSVLFPSVRSIPSLTHEVRDFRTLNSKLYIHYCPSYGFLLSCLRNRKTDMVLIYSYHSPSLYGSGSGIQAFTINPYLA